MFALTGRRFLDAARHYHQSLRSLIDATDVVWLFKPLAGLAVISVKHGEVEAAARLVGAVDQILLGMGGRLFPFDQAAYDQAEAAARVALGEERFATAHDAGKRLSLAALLAEADVILDTAALKEHLFASPAHGVAEVMDPAVAVGLTPRERDVLRLLATRWTDREIADALFLSHRTVSSHVASILAKLGVHSRREAVARARELALLPETAEASPYT
jgi:DNA-binding CsgD family transcriptional regulator